MFLKSNNFLFCAFISLLTLSSSLPVLAHESGGYSHDAEKKTRNAEWMKNLYDTTKLGDISIPGTHNTMSYEITTDVIAIAGGAAVAVAALGGGPIFGSITGVVTNQIIVDVTKCQSMSLSEQLESGIRFIDIRIGFVGDEFHIYHGFISLSSDFKEVMTTVNKFLDRYPSETVIMRLKQDHEGKNKKDFDKVFDEKMGALGSKVYTGLGNLKNLKLSSLRGKIVILNDFNRTSVYAPLPYKSNSTLDRIDTQDIYKVGSIGGLYDKWEAVKKHLRDANDRSDSNVYLNYLSGAYGVFPYFVASGHSSPGTTAPRLATGLTTPAFKNKYPDFPRTTCIGDLCTISYEGTNQLTTDYLREGNIKYSGIVAADFPGPDLIKSIIALNKGRPQAGAVESQKAYLFRENDTYYRFKDGHGVEVGYPASTSKSWDFDGKEILGAVRYDNDHVYYFLEGGYYGRLEKDGSSSPGYPKKITDKNWPGLAPHADRIKAVVNWGNGNIYFFLENRGPLGGTLVGEGEYVRWNTDKGKIDLGPRSIEGHWGKLGDYDTDITAAVNWWNGKAYFFLEGGEYIRWDLETDKVSGPIKTSKYWLGVSDDEDITAAFRHRRK